MLLSPMMLISLKSFIPATSLSLKSVSYRPTWIVTEFASWTEGNPSWARRSGNMAITFAMRIWSKSITYILYYVYYVYYVYLIYLYNILYEINWTYMFIDHRKPRNMWAEIPLNTKAFDNSINLCCLDPHHLLTISILQARVQYFPMAGGGSF